MNFLGILWKFFMREFKPAAIKVTGRFESGECPLFIDMWSSWCVGWSVDAPKCI